MKRDERKRRLEREAAAGDAEAIARLKAEARRERGGRDPRPPTPKERQTAQAVVAVSKVSEVVRAGNDPRRYVDAIFESMPPHVPCMFGCACGLGFGINLTLCLFW